MPVYEYERADGSRFCELQAVDAAPLQSCPYTGQACLRIIGRVVVVAGSDEVAQERKGYYGWLDQFERAKAGVHAQREAERKGDVIEVDAPAPGPSSPRDRVRVEGGYAIVD